MSALWIMLTQVIRLFGSYLLLSIVSRHISEGMHKRPALTLTPRNRTYTVKGRTSRARESDSAESLIRIQCAASLYVAKTSEMTKAQSN